MCALIYCHRYRKAMELSDAYRKTENGLELDVMVSPNSGKSGIEGLDEWRKRVIVKVKSPPLDGKANREVEEVLEKITGCRCSIIRGQTSRQKTVRIDGNCEEISHSVEKSLK